MEKPLVSVLMTVYNREKYIAEAIESVIASTYKNWELIIVDDQSKDNSVAIAKSYAQKDTRIKIHINDVNLGDYPNRNQAARYANGKYLKYLDADDIIYPFGLEQLVFYMEKFPESAYGLCSLSQDKQNIYPFMLGPREAYYRHYFEFPIFHKAPLSAIIKKVDFDEVGGFTGKQHLGDFEMWHILSKSKNVVLMPQGLVWYREHDDQQMNDNRTDPYVPFKYLLLSEEMLKSNSCPLSAKEADKALELNYKKQSRAVLSAAKHHSFKKSFQLYKESKNVTLFSILNSVIS
ncbi:glycosyltransferase family 2 protein [Winogradskyella sp. SYSU M77433]|uniref:glycosyltransferase family 2 protein n=1 Tax=Winogradskyella sp. SYSU M77433 TaxID=3042722 RepID=UPI00248158E3|nr:glycosyltransferase family 2 protein [Winogradskyella sp. SYSU M77433]MDH7911518.1 glycosyltransferase family 2 protein [Winogradskyella sp. SYSU M77433]